MDHIIPSSVVPEISDIQKLIAKQDRDLSLQQEFYTDPAVFQHDMERIFGRHWTIAGHIGSIPKPGDFFLTEIGSESIIIARGEIGQ